MTITKEIYKQMIKNKKILILIFSLGPINLTHFQNYAIIFLAKFGDRVIKLLDDNIDLFKSKIELQNNMYIN